MSAFRSSVIMRATENLRQYRRLRRLKNASLAVAEQDYPAYVINLERSVERREYITSHLLSIGIKPTLIKAVDGKQLSEAEVVAQGKYDDAVSHRSFDRSLSLAEIGCGLSHISIYEAMARDQIPVALVMEDDAQFTPDARERIEAVLATAPSDWGVIQLRFDCRDFEPAGPDLVRFRFASQLPVAATAYLINLNAARILAAQALPVRYPADSLLGRVNQWHITVYGTWPELVGVNNVFPSAIQGERNSRFRAANLVKSVLLKVFG